MNNNTSIDAIGGVDGYDKLRNAIILQATEDLRTLMRGRKPIGVSFTEIYKFFVSQWGQLLLRDIDGEWLYQKLINEDMPNV